MQHYHPDPLLHRAAQAFQLLKLGIVGFLFDFWTWFFDGNCATYIQALPNFTNTINAMPNLGYKCASCCALPRSSVPNMLSHVPVFAPHCMQSQDVLDPGRMLSSSEPAPAS